MNYIDAVPSLKGHQQKPTYVEHDSRLLSCIYFSSTLCHDLKLVGISSDWFDCILFLLMSVQSTLCRINDNIWYKKSSYFKLVYCKIRDCIIGVFNLVVVLQPLSVIEKLCRHF